MLHNSLLHRFHRLSLVQPEWQSKQRNVAENSPGWLGLEVSHDKYLGSACCYWCSSRVRPGLAFHIQNYALTRRRSIATSMLACIVMEIKGVTLPRSAAVSALRYANNGPQSLTLALRDTYSRVGAWALANLLLYLTTLALQFGSTMLVGISPLDRS